MKNLPSLVDISPPQVAAEDPEDLRRVIDASLKKWGLEPQRIRMGLEAAARGGQGAARESGKFSVWIGGFASSGDLIGNYDDFR